MGSVQRVVTTAGHTRLVGDPQVAICALLEASLPMVENRKSSTETIKQLHGEVEPLCLQSSSAKQPQKWGNSETPLVIGTSTYDLKRLNYDQFENLPFSLLNYASVRSDYIWAIYRGVTLSVGL